MDIVRQILKMDIDTSQVDIQNGYGQEDIQYGYGQVDIQNGYGQVDIQNEYGQVYFQYVYRLLQGCIKFSPPPVEFLIWFYSRDSLKLMLNLLDTDCKIGSALEGTGMDKKELEKNKQKVKLIFTTIQIQKLVPPFTQPLS